LPFDRALATAAGARSLGEAFLAGYQAALRSLVPVLPEERRVCLCATEAQGAHPRAIQARLAREGAGWRLDGRKRWATGAPLADLLLVVASTGVSQDGKNALRVACVDARANGVTLHPMPETPFVPEIPHAEVELVAVALADDALLPGDGYQRYLKPFRTVEDIHVFAAVLAHLGGSTTLARELELRVIALLATLRALATADPLAPETHLVLAGTLDHGRRLIDEAMPTLEARWQRDRPLLDVATAARAARTEAAFAAIRAR
jgi:alkylation response protein AidB-like acyl-CoA dehydrogenase